MTLPIGALVGPFRVEALLGKGGSASIYSGRHGELGHLVAIKVFDPGLTSDPELRQRFLAEGRMMAQLRHPGVLAVSDLIAQEGLAALIMEYADGPDLGRLIAQEGGLLRAGQIAEIFPEVLRALSFLHARGVVHRDLKPSNVLLTHGDNGRLMPKITDFGIAYTADPALMNPALIARGAHPLGTPAFTSPEQARGAPPHPSADLFSVGVVLCEAATGRHPFEGASHAETLAKLAAGAVAHPLALDPALDPRLAHVIATALALDPAKRYPSAAAMNMALQEALAPAPPRQTLPTLVPSVAPLSSVRTPSSLGAQAAPISPVRTPSSQGVLVIQGRRQALDRSPFTVGSAAGCDLVIAAHLGVAGKHLVLEESPQGWEMRALAETFLNGQPTGSAALRDQAILRIGRTPLRFTDGAARPVGLTLYHPDGRSWPIDSRGLVIGSAPHCDIILPSGPARWAKVGRVGFDASLQVLDKSEPVLMGEISTQFRILRGGEVLRFGATALLVEQGGP